MGYRFVSIFAAVLVCAAAPAAAQDARYAASQLMAADRAFSNAGAKANIVEAIGAMLTDNAVMPTPKLDFAIGKTAIIDALKANPAKALYQRLGFRLIGETETHWQMLHDPAA